MLTKEKRNSIETGLNRFGTRCFQIFITIYLVSFFSYCTKLHIIFFHCNYQYERDYIPLTNKIVITILDALLRFLKHCKILIIQ